MISDNSGFEGLRGYVMRRERRGTGVGGDGGGGDVLECVIAVIIFFITSYVSTIGERNI